MALSNVFDSLQAQLPRFESHYAKTHARSTTLRSFATTTSLVEALDQKSPVTQATRYAIVGEVVAEHRAHPHPVWPALLVLAFAPMLQRLRTRVGGRPADADRDQRVIIAFLEAIKSVGVENAGAFATVALRRTTERAVFGQKTEESNEPTFESFSEHKHTPCDPFGLTEQEKYAEIALARRAKERDERERRDARQRVRPFPKARRVAA